MPVEAIVLLDDRLLVEELLVGLETGRREPTLFSGPFEQLPPAEQERAILSLLELREDIGLPDPRATVPTMADISRRHSQLNLLNLEAVAAGRLLSARIWLSETAASGVLPAVLDAEGVQWTVVTID
jgi:hypothetical protein